MDNIRKKYETFEKEWDKIKSDSGSDKDNPFQKLLQECAIISSYAEDSIKKIEEQNEEVIKAISQHEKTLQDSKDMMKEALEIRNSKD